MKKYCSDGQLGFLFNGKENLNDFSGYRMVVFELGAIVGNETLFRLVTAMITMLTNRIIEKARARMREVWMDECWRMLLDPHFGIFINMLSKTIRKKDGGITVIVQEVGDILRSTYAEAIINNAGTFIALSHEDKESQIEKHREVLNLTADELSLLLSIKKKDHAAFIKQGSQSGVYKVNISPEHYAVFTSTRLEKEALRNLLAQWRGNLVMAVEEFVDKDLGAVKRPKTE
jgi:type IV secretory pathway VirB4 component